MKSMVSISVIPVHVGCLFSDGMSTSFARLVLYAKNSIENGNRHVDMFNFQEPTLKTACRNNIRST